MENTATTTRTAELSGLIYKNMKMGADSIINLMPKANDERLKYHLTALLDGYEKFSSEAKKVLESEGVQPKEENPVAKMTAKMGINMKTMTDSTPSHIAELLMEGAVMGICETTRALHNFENTDCRPEVLQLARDIIAFEDKNLIDAKSFL
jgi:hypothetical protein